jgi:hypothetical protein
MLDFSFLFLCIAAVAIVYINRDKCEHTWKDKSVETTTGLGGSQYRVTIQKCSKCGKNHMEKLHIN